MVRLADSSPEAGKPLGPFDSVEVSGAIDASLQSGAPGIMVRPNGSEGAVRYAVRDGVLHVWTQGGYAGPNPSVVIVASELNGLQLAGSGNIVASQVLKDEASVSLNGSGSIALVGPVGALSLELTGSGSIDARGASTDSAKAGLNGSGAIRLGSVRQLDADLTGSGNITYQGTPRLALRVNGSGQVARLG